mmetsp:Transcript_2748/g.6350  ORF Transcript_2748/g.6350 Transcript_2748/m.6350 type:complete len:104 (+) Transcript_2748:379-690(+)
MRQTESYVRTRNLIRSQIEKTKVALEILNKQKSSLKKIDDNSDRYMKIIRIGKRTMTGFLNSKTYDSLKIWIALLVYVLVIIFTIWRRFPFSTWNSIYTYLAR